VRYLGGKRRRLLSLSAVLVVVGDIAAAECVLSEQVSVFLFSFLPCRVTGQSLILI
jgi:hypothetical protein